MIAPLVMYRAVQVPEESSTHQEAFIPFPSEHKYVVYTFIYVVYLVEIRNSAT